MSNEVTSKLNTFINEIELDFKRVQIDNTIEFAQEAHFALQSLTDNDFLLQTARKDPQSLKNAIMNVATIGLTLNKAHKYAYLVPRKGKVCLDVSYIGLIKLATDSGSVKWAQCELVYSKDDFAFNGIGEKPTHKYNPFSERGDLVGAYSCVKTHDNDFLVCVMNINEINEIRDRSEAFKKGHGPWVDFYSEMVKKTVLKRASKLWPKSNERLLKAIDVINEHEGIDFKQVDALDEDFPIPPEEKIIGDNYRILNGKFRSKKLGEISIPELTKYFDELQNRVFKPDHKKKWELELYNVLNEYLNIVNDN
jgi:recombination protein RecT